MNRYGIAIALLVGLPAFGLGGAAAAGDAVLRGKPTLTGYSGPDASMKHSLLNPAPTNAAISGIVAGESGATSNDPCFLKVNLRDVTTGAPSSLSFGECGGSHTDDKTLTVPDDSFVTGVRVCLNSDQDKVKGIQLLTGVGACVLGAEAFYLEPADCTSVVKIQKHDYRLCGTDTPAFVVRSCQETGSSSRYFERSNCVGTNNGPDGDWEAQVNCPPGQVATGMKLNTREGDRDRRMVNGIAIECYELTEN